MLIIFFDWPDSLYFKSNHGAVGQSIQCYFKCKEKHETCAKVIGIQSIINWGFPNMFELLRGYQIHSLASYEQIIISASKHKLISADDIEVMLNFYKNPFEYDWGEFYEKEADFRF